MRAPGPSFALPTDLDASRTSTLSDRVETVRLVMSRANEPLGVAVIQFSLARENAELAVGRRDILLCCLSRTLVLPVTIVMWIGNTAHVSLSAWQIFGGLGVPALGLVGAALAESLTFLLLVATLTSAIRMFRLHRGAWRRFGRDSFPGTG